jgi:cysteine synthase A
VLGATHTELRLSAAGPALIEINPRLAGGMIPEVIRVATGLDLVEQQLRAASGLSPALGPVRSGHAGIQFLLPDRPGVLKSVAGVEEAAAIPGVERVVITGASGKAVRPARDAYDRIGYVIAHHDHAEQVTAILDMAVSAIRLRIEASPQ